MAMVFIHRPPLSRSLKTGGSLAYSAALLSEVEDRVLSIPGARADDFVDRIRMSVDSYLKRDYANFNPMEQRLRRPKPYQPTSFRNILQTAITTAVEAEFKDFRTDLPPPPGAGTEHENRPPILPDRNLGR